MCNDRPEPNSPLSIRRRDNDSFRRKRTLACGLSVRPGWTPRALISSHPRCWRGWGRDTTGLSLPDGQPKSGRRRQASHSTRAAQLQPERARGCAQPVSCWPNPRLQCIYPYCMRHSIQDRYYFRYCYSQQCMVLHSIQDSY